MNKKEIAQAEELIDSVRRGDPPRMVEAVFPEGDQMSSEPGRIDPMKEVECDCDPMYAHRCMKCGGRGFIPRKTGEPVRPATPAVPDARQEFEQFMRWWSTDHNCGDPCYEDVALRSWRARSALIREAGEMLVNRPTDGKTPVGVGAPAEICQNCHQAYGVWFAANEVWNKVIPDRVGMLCPNCFINRAERQGFECTGWQLVPEYEVA